MKKICTVVALMAVLVGVISCGSGNQDREKILSFTAIPDQNTTELMQKFAPLTEYLSQKLGVKVEYVPSRDYQASVEMFRAGDIQLAWFGGLTGVQARAAVPGAQAIAQGQVDPEYYSYFIANKETGLNKSEGFPEEMGQYEFTFGSESSTSGRLMPEFFIKLNSGKSVEDFFSKEFSFSGSHDKTVELVEAGQFGCGVVNYKVYDKRVASGKTDPEVCRIIWKTPTYADYNFTAHPGLDDNFGPGFMKKLQDVLIGIEDASLLSALPREKLIKARNEEFIGIAEVARQLGMVR
ncbi:MAG: putative selenate ABC transporter substrate-binding protein [bacterium]|nr:putative selenate ABC transporter substrate-binding protein [bacterium]